MTPPVSIRQKLPATPLEGGDDFGSIGSRTRSLRRTSVR